MSSLFDIGKSGLQSYQRALSVTGQNIANINTDGYKRREIRLEEISALQGGITEAPNRSGLGVRMDDIRRSFNEFLLNNFCFYCSNDARDLMVKRCIIIFL